MKTCHYCTTKNLYPPSHGIPTSQLIFLSFLLLSPSILHITNAQQPSNSTLSSIDDNNNIINNDGDDNDALQGSKASPSLALIVIVLVLVFFITGCISIYIQQCTDNSSIGGDPATGLTTRDGDLLRMNLRGLDQSLIDTFPTFVYSEVKELKLGKESLECAVCLNEFEDHETLRLLPKCDHVFHAECIDTWLSAHSTCPVCRSNLVPDPDDSLVKEETREGEEGGDELSPSYEVEVVVLPESSKRRVPRSHSTGHSLVLASDDRERFKLRLPEEVRKQLMAARPKLKRTTSLVALPRVSSSRRGYRSSGGGGGGDGSGSSRYRRFFGRSFKWTTRYNGGDGDDGSTRSNSKRYFGTVVTPLEGLPRLPV